MDAPQNSSRYAKSLPGKHLKKSAFLVLLCCMEHQRNIATRLLKVSEELAAIAKEMAGEQVDAVFPRAAIERMQAGHCLGCERTPEQITEMRRGLCQACYQRVRKVIRENPTKESSLIAKGAIAPEGFKLPSKESMLDRLLAEAAEIEVDRELTRQQRKLDERSHKRAKRPG